MTSQTTDNLELPLLDDQSNDSFYAGWVEAMTKINNGDKVRQADIAAEAERAGDAEDALTALVTDAVKVSPSLFNVKGYGAMGDGVTDDTTAVRAAYNLAKIAGGVVYFPPGSYYFNKSGSASVIQ
jgi:polygalacturonase